MIKRPSLPPLSSAIKGLIRDVPDYPKPGILFKDITPVLGNPSVFRRVTEAMASPFVNERITHVVAVESRGFILGGPIAQQLDAGFVPVRKPGKLPHKTLRQDYALEYGTDALEIHADACEPAARVLVVDDVLATGGTAEATVRLVETLGASVVGLTFLAWLEFLPGLRRLEGRTVCSLVSY